MFEARRRRLMEQMGDGVAIVFAAPERTRSNDTQYRYRQDSYLHYLTGFPEPESVLVLRPGGEPETVMFVRNRDRERETWDGRRAGPEGARGRYGADEAYTIDELGERLPGLIENADRLFYDIGRYPEFDAKVLDALKTVRARGRTGVRAPSAMVGAASLLDEMRLIKTQDEVKLMRTAGEISAHAHTEAMRAMRPGLREWELEALIEYHFRRAGASGPAYSTIAGSGANATILHYVENDAVCQDGELFLVDAGAEYAGYSADITRTYPVSGKFTAPQKAVYEVVLASQMAAIEASKPGTTFDRIHEIALRTLVEGLVSLKVLSGDVDGLIESDAYKPYYMHRTGHWLGLDVHDVGDYRSREEGWRRLEPGMVMTVEPGLYFAEDLTEVPEAFRGMGIRIEDDVLVTAGEPDVLTAGTPKTVADVESTMAESPIAVAPAQP